MSAFALFVLILWVAAFVLCLVQAFLGRVSPGWLGVAVGILAYLLGSHLS